MIDETILRKRLDNVDSMRFISKYDLLGYEMSTNDAIDLAHRAVVHAAHRASALGNIV